jgi:hypothetical protein
MAFLVLTVLNAEVVITWDVMIFGVLMYACANFFEESAAFS